MPVLRDSSRRTPAHASNQLKKRGVKPLLKVVGGRKVEHASEPPRQQATPENLSASPESSDGEGENSICLPLSPFNTFTGSKSERNVAPAASGSQPPRKARSTDSRRPHASPESATKSTYATRRNTLKDDLDEDEKIFFSMRSSQVAKTRTYGSQSSQNIHTASKASKKSEPLLEKNGNTQASGFKRPRALPDDTDRPPRATFKRPPALAESPRSSFTNTFRTPRSSPPMAVAISTSSAQQIDDDSPLSSLPPTPEREASLEVQPILRNGISMLPCPLCHGLVSQAFLESFNNGRSLRWTDKVAFCQSHKAQEAEAQRTKKQYPAIDWSELPTRMSKFYHTIEAILERRKDSYYRNIVDESVTTGQDRNAFRAVEGDGQANAVPGYYGLRGARMMQEHILAAFSTKIRRLAGKDKAIPRTGPAGYVQTVLAPEMAVLLVMEDFPDIDAEQARCILAESAEVGKLMTDNDDDVARSKSFVAVDQEEGDRVEVMHGG